MIVHGNPRERRHRLRLRAARQNGKLVWIVCAQILRPDKAAVGNSKPVQLVGDFNVVHHAAPDETNLSPAHRRDVDHLLNAVNRAREAREDNLSRRGAAKLFKRHRHGAFGWREARPLDVRAVAEEREHAFLPVARKRVQIERLAVDRRLVNLEIAGMNDHAHRRSNCQSNAINRAVRHVQEFDLERAKLNMMSRRNFAQVRLFHHVPLCKFLVNKRECELSAVHGNVEIAKDVRERADVILVRVCE